MESHRKNPGSAREPEHTPSPRFTEERRRRLVHAGEAVALTLAAVALACLIASCSGSDPQASTTSSTPTAEQVAETAAQPAGLTAVTGRTRLGVEALPTIAAADSLPPDVSAWGPDSVLAPGSVVEISAKGSDDVVEMVLTDGLGKKQWMVYDDNEDVWRAFYRVPVNGSSDRLGLSVTAKNNLSRWHRVWVFLQIQLDGC
jgi:hypothetical protein